MILPWGGVIHFKLATLSIDYIYIIIRLVRIWTSIVSNQEKFQHIDTCLIWYTYMKKLHGFKLMLAFDLTSTWQYYVMVVNILKYNTYLWCKIYGVCFGCRIGFSMLHLNNQKFMCRNSWIIMLYPSWNTHI